MLKPAPAAPGPELQIRAIWAQLGITINQFKDAESTRQIGIRSLPMATANQSRYSFFSETLQNEFRMAALTPDLPQVEQHIVEMTNQARRKQDLPVLKVNAMLSKAARAFAQKVATSGTFSHSADGRTPSERAESVGYKHCEIAENLAMDQNAGGFGTGELALQAVAGWMNSPPHRANILRASVSEIGVGVARAPGAKPKFISVELFGRPASKILTFKIRNLTNIEVRYAYGSKDYELKPGASVVHSSCAPERLVITKPGGLFSSSTEIAALVPENKTIYTLKLGTSGGPVLETNIAIRSKVP